MTANVSMTFEAAHMLEGYNGDCRNLHGHTYTLNIGVSSRKGPDMENPDMVMDFRTIKYEISQIISKYDHAFIFGNQPLKPSNNKDVYVTLLNIGSKICTVRGRSTAENILCNIVQEIEERGVLKVEHAELYEGMKNCVVWNAEVDSHEID